MDEFFKAMLINFSDFVYILLNKHLFLFLSKIYWKHCL